MSKRSYSLLEITLTGRQKHLINTTHKKKFKTRKYQKYLALRQIFSPKNFFLRGQCEIYYTSLPNAPPSDATSKQTQLILHLQVFKLHNSSEKANRIYQTRAKIRSLQQVARLRNSPTYHCVYLK